MASTEEVKDQVKDKSAAIASYDTLQVVSALLVGIAAALWPEVRNLKATPVDDSFSDVFLNEFALVVLIVVIVLNLCALLFLSVNIFYLHQCLAKDDSGALYTEFSIYTKGYRSHSVVAVFNSMPLLMLVVGTLFYRETDYRSASNIASTMVFVATLAVSYVISDVRKNWARMRKKMKEKDT